MSSDGAGRLKVEGCLSTPLREEYATYRRSGVGRFYLLLFPLSFSLGIFCFFGLSNFCRGLVYLGILPVLLLIPRQFYLTYWAPRGFSPSLLRQTEFMAICYYCVATLGYFGLYRKVAGYDDFAHLVACLFGVIFIGVNEAVKEGSANSGKPPSLAKVAVFTLVLALGWEYFEKYGDMLFGTRMFFDPFQPIAMDVARDLGFDVLGVVLGIAVFRTRWPRWKAQWRWSPISFEAP